MEVCFRISSPVDQAVAVGSILGRAELRGRDQGSSTTVQLVLPRPAEVSCPKPCRASRASLAGEDISRSPCHSTRSFRSWLRTDPIHDHLSLLMPKDEMEDVRCYSPPARADNPVVHDLLFISRTSGCPSLAGEGEVIEEPMVRIEGFACGGS